MEAQNKRGQARPIDSRRSPTGRRPENRMEALKPVVEKLGGQVLAWAYTILMSPDEDFDAMLLAQGAGYRPPGG